MTIRRKYIRLRTGAAAIAAVGLGLAVWCGAQETTAAANLTANATAHEVASATATAEANSTLQLVSEQDTITPGGRAAFYLLYYAAADAEGTVDIAVEVPEGMTVADSGGAAWDEAARTLVWTFAGGEAGPKAARFELATAADAAIGTTYRLSAKAALGADVRFETPNVAIELGTETHQPFMQGYPDGTFRPDGLLTRAETAAMIARIEGLETYDERPAYPDVDASHWAFRYVQQVTKEGYMVGDSGRFRPEDPITKAEFVMLVLRLRGVDAVPFAPGFPDVAGHWASDALGTALALGFVAEDGPLERALFAPNEPIRRELAAQWASVGLYRGPLHDGETEVVRHFPDVPETHPYFDWVEEASAVAHEAENRGDGAEYLIRYLPEATRPF